ncbi:MAG: hypothetical protein LVT47_02220 [Cyanobacteria bacterium LVE1205-1]|jgi:hypothetical protein
MKHRNRLLNVWFHPYLPVVLGIVVLTLGIGNGAQIIQLTQSFSTLTTTIGGIMEIGWFNIIGFIPYCYPYWHL